MLREKRKRFRFPGGKRKCLVMSYDDGSEHDRRLVEVFNRYGVRGSFHLNSGKLGMAHHVRHDEVAPLYEGHEVSSHTVNHPYLTQLPDDRVRREVLDDKKALEDVVGRPVRGLAYPFGDYDDRIVSLASEAGMEYGRTIACTDGFGLPETFPALATTCHHNRAMAVGEKFLADETEEPRLLFVWGHSYELDGFMAGEPDKDWRYMEAFCRMMQNGDIHFATIIEVVDALRNADQG